MTLQSLKGCPVCADLGGWCALHPRSTIPEAPGSQDMGALSGSRASTESVSRLGPSGFDPERLHYLDRLHPQPQTPDWRDVEAVAQWIEATRWRAFFAGARHEEISRAEAAALVLALSERTGA